MDSRFVHSPQELIELTTLFNQFCQYKKSVENAKQLVMSALGLDYDANPLDPQASLVEIGFSNFSIAKAPEKLRALQNDELLANLTRVLVDVHHALSSVLYGSAISEEEHNLLMSYPKLALNRSIKNYANIIPSQNERAQRSMFKF